MKQRKRTNRLILHHSLSDHADVEEIDRWHRGRGFACIGYHYVIQKDGRLQVGRPRDVQGAHALGRNGDSIGCCLVGDFRCYEPTVEQLERLGLLYHDLAHFYDKQLRVEFHRPHVFNIFEPTEYGRFDACPGRVMDRADVLHVIERFDPFASWRRATAVRGQP